MADPLAELTGSERATLELIGESLTNRQIAVRMSVAEKTVKSMYPTYCANCT